MENQEVKKTNFHNSNYQNEDIGSQNQFDSYWAQFDAVGLEFAYMMENHSRQYYNWWQKIESLIAKAKSKYPVEFTIDKTDQIIPIKIPINKATIKTNENFCHTNTVHRNRITKISSTESRKNFPSVCNEIYPSDINVIEDVLVLRLDLLANWTSSLKEIDEVLMDYVLHILEYWSRLNIANSFDPDQLNGKNDIFESLAAIETLLNEYWKDSPQLENLQNKIGKLKKELESQKNHSENQNKIINKPDYCNSYSSLSSFETFIFQKRAINILIGKYKELYKNWEYYKYQVDNAVNISSLRSRINRSKIFPNDLSKTEQSLSYVSSETQSIWSKYIDSQIEKKQFIEKHCFDKYPLISVSPQKMELVSKKNVFDIKSGLQNSRIDITVPGEKQMRFYQNKPITIQSEKRITSTIDISHYFTRSLLPSQRNIDLISINKVNNPTVGNDLTTINYRDSSLQRSKSTYNRMSSQRIDFNRSKTQIHSVMGNYEKLNMNKIPDASKSFFVVLNLPCIEKISSILDKKQRKLLTPQQAKENGLCDETFLEILDTDSKIKYSFRAAILKGLVMLNLKDNNKKDKMSLLSEEHFTKEVYKIEEILDPDRNEWINVKVAINRHVLNQHSGLLKLNSTEYQHIAKVINSPNVRGRRIYHCNAKSLPPEMTIEISKVF